MVSGLPNTPKRKWTSGLSRKSSGASVARINVSFLAKLSFSLLVCGVLGINSTAHLVSVVGCLTFFMCLVCLSIFLPYSSGILIGPGGVGLNMVESVQCIQ